MTTIETGKYIRLENVISLRKKMTSMEIDQEMVKIEKFCKANGINKIGPAITTTYAIEKSNIFDIEIVVPIDQVAKLPEEYRFKSIFKLMNTRYVRHEGNPDLLQKVYNEMLECM